MRSIHVIMGVALMLVTISSLTFRPALAAGSLMVSPSTFSPGGTVVITLTETHSGKVKSFIVTKPDGDVCTAPGGPVSKNSPLSRTFPTDFTPSPKGDGTCDSSLVGGYEVEAKVLVKTTIGNGNNNNQGNDEKGSDPDEAITNNGDNECSGDDNMDDNTSDSGGECTITHKASFEADFFVLPESPLGAAGIVGASLAALGSFLYVKKAF